MPELTKRIEEETFEMEVQYCNPNECLHDCVHPGVNNCDAVDSGWW